MTESEYTPKLEDYRKISRPKAKKLFNEGVTLYLLPCKCSRVCLTETCGISPATITQDNDAGRTFEKLVNSFEYYNCNRETGYYTHFYYIPEDRKRAISEGTVSTSDTPVEYEGKEHDGFYLY